MGFLSAPSNFLAQWFHISVSNVLGLTIISMKNGRIYSYTNVLYYVITLYMITLCYYYVVYTILYIIIYVYMYISLYYIILYYIIYSILVHLDVILYAAIMSISLCVSRSKQVILLVLMAVVSRLHPVSITRFPLRRFSPGAGLLRYVFFIGSG